MMALCCDIRGLKMWRGFSLAFENNDADEEVKEDDDEGAAAGHPARSLFEFGASMRDDIASLLGAMVSASSCASVRAMETTTVATDSFTALRPGH